MPAARQRKYSVVGQFVSQPCIAHGQYIYINAYIFIFRRSEMYLQEPSANVHTRHLSRRLLTGK